MVLGKFTEGATVIPRATQLLLTVQFALESVSSLPWNHCPDSRGIGVQFGVEYARPGAMIHSDGSPAYKKLESIGYKLRQTVHLGSETPAHESMPGVHRIASLLQRWIMGTHHGAVQPGQLDYYLDEYVFRFNRRTSRSRGLLFYRLLQQAVMTSPVTYNKIADVSKKSGNKRPWS